MRDVTGYPRWRLLARRAYRRGWEDAVAKFTQAGAYVPGVSPSLVKDE